MDLIGASERVTPTAFDEDRSGLVEGEGAGADDSSPAREEFRRRPGPDQLLTELTRESEQLADAVNQLATPSSPPRVGAVPSGGDSPRMRSSSVLERIDDAEPWSDPGPINLPDDTEVSTPGEMAPAASMALRDREGLSERELSDLIAKNRATVNDILDDREPSEAAGVSVLPKVLRDDLQGVESAAPLVPFQWRWLVLALLLALGLVAQYLWFMPDDLIARYPMARPWVEQVCEPLQCRYQVRVDRSKIDLLSRDVRIHPAYEGALQVTLSMINQADFSQSFPHIQFTLFNVNGGVIVSRTFAPPEYIEDDARRAIGLEPNDPVQVVLDLLAPEEAAVSFEFRFI
ncbi:MAG: DUF3426 domain-containing protein [Pseudomonadota bacterium]